MDICHQCGTLLRQVGGLYICQNNHISQSHYVEDMESLATIPSSGFRHSRVISRKGKRKKKNTKRKLTNSEKQERTRQRKIKRDKIIGNESIYLIDFFQSILILQCKSLVDTISLPGAQSPDPLEQITKELWLLYIDYFSSTITCSTTKGSESNNFEEQAKIVLSNNTLTLGMPALLAILLCGCFYLHLPITYTDIHDWIIQSKIPYLSAYKMVPQFSKDLFVLERIYGLSAILRPKTIPSSKKIGIMFRKCMVLYTKNIQVIFPSANVPALLLKYVNRMYLPLPIYHLALSLVSSIPDSTWHISKAGVISDPLYRIMAILIITIKIIFGFNPNSNDSRLEQSVEFHLPKFSELRLIWKEDLKRRSKQEPWLERNPYSFSDSQWKSYMKFCSDQVVQSFLNAKVSKFMDTIIKDTIEPRVNELNGFALEKIDSIDINNINLLHPDMSRHPPLIYCGNPNAPSPIRPFISWNPESLESASSDYYALIEMAHIIVGCSQDSMHRIVSNLENRIRSIWSSVLQEWVNKSVI